MKIPTHGDLIESIPKVAKTKYQEIFRFAQTYLGRIHLEFLSGTEDQ